MIIGIRVKWSGIRQSKVLKYSKGTYQQLGHIAAEQVINNRLTVHIFKGCLYGSCVGLLSEKTHLCLYSIRKVHLTCHDYFVVFAFDKIIVTLF